MKTKGVNDIKPNSHEKIKHTRSFDLRFTIRFENEKDFNFFTPFHWHDHIEIIYINKGKMEFHIQNRNYILKPGDAVIVNSELIHSSKLIGEVSYFLLQIPLSAFDKIENCPFYFNEHLSKEESKNLEPLLSKMLENYEDKVEGCQVRFVSYMYELLALLISDYQNKDAVEYYSADSIERKIAKAISYIEKNYRDEISLSALASLINVSPEYFCRQFKKVTDMTLSDYIMSLRVASFYGEFINSDKKISVLMENNGIKNYKIFLREFKKVYGKTPEMIRSEIHQKK